MERFKPFIDWTRNSARVNPVALVILCATACSTTTDLRDQEETGSDAPVVTVAPIEDCPTVEPDLTSVMGAKLEERGLFIDVKTTTFCNQHEFAVHTCNITDDVTTYRVSETNDCEMPNDGVVEHVLFIEAQNLGEARSVDSFDAAGVTIRQK